MPGAFILWAELDLGPPPSSLPTTYIAVEDADVSPIPGQADPDRATAKQA